METPPKYALPMIASTSTVALISVPGGEGGIAAGTFIETMTFCCAAGPSVNAAGTTVTQGTTGTGPAVKVNVCVELKGFCTGTTNDLERPWLV